MQKTQAFGQRRNNTKIKPIKATIKTPLTEVISGDPQKRRLAHVNALVLVIYP
jgi:hypothetical protein